MPAATRTPSASSAPTGHGTSTPASSSSTTATTPASRRCWTSSASRPRTSLMTFSVADDAGTSSTPARRERPVRQPRAPRAPRVPRAWSPTSLRFNREPRALLASGRRRLVARRLARRAALLARVRRPADRAAGRPPCGRPTRARCGASRRASSRVLRKPRDARPARPPALATVAGGSARYVEALTRPFARPHPRSRRRSAAVHAPDDHVEVTPAGGEPRAFDEVVLACHADQALRDARRSERPRARAPRRVPVPGNEAVLHTDARLLPRRRAAWASWNYHLLASRRRRTTVTYDMNRCRRLDAPAQFCVTLNRTEAIDPATASARSATRTRSTPPTGCARRRGTARSAARNRTHFCGAYWGWGFHEDGVVSGAAASREPAPPRRGAAPHERARSTTARSATGASRPVARVPPRRRARSTSTSTSCRRCSAAGSSRPRRRRSARFRRADYLGEPGVPLADAVRALVARAARPAPGGPVRLLTQLARSATASTP